VLKVTLIKINSVCDEAIHALYIRNHFNYFPVSITENSIVIQGYMLRFSAKYFLFVVIGLLCGVTFAQQQAYNYRFEKIDVEQGLSSNRVYSIAQDQTGFLWFGTEDGLNRYDGYKFKVFRHEPDDSNSISDNSVWSLMVDRSGKLWIGTKAGELNRYNPETEKFESWKIKSDRTKENSITCVYEDRIGNIWIGTYGDGIYRLNPSNKNLDHWSSEPDNPKSLSHNYVRSILEDNEGNILIATYIGFNKFNPKNSNDFERHLHISSNQNSLSNNIVWSLTKSFFDSTLIWLGTANGLTIFNTVKNTFSRVNIPNPQNLLYGTGAGRVTEEFIGGKRFVWVDSYAGLLRIDLQTNETNRFLHDEDNPHSLIDNQINSTFKDRSGVLWIATNNGISYLSSKSSKFNSKLFTILGSENLAALNRMDITALTKTRDGTIWFGTAGGLYFFNPEYNNVSLKAYPKLENIPVWSLAEGRDGDLWVGSFGLGLKQINLKTGTIKSWNLDHPRTKTQSLYYNRTLLKDNRNNIWVGYWGVGVARINPASQKYDVWLNDSKDTLALSNNDVWVIKEDRLGRIWIGTGGGGLNLFQESDHVSFHHWGQNKNGLNGNNIYSIYEALNTPGIKSSETILWIGASNGLNKFIVRNKGANIYDVEVDVSSFSVKDGLPDNSIKSILEDDGGNLWLGTGNGISYLNIRDNTFTNFTYADGLSNSVFNYESALMLNEDIMLFGSTKGITSFTPEDIVLSTLKPPVVITDFQIFNASVKTGEDSPLKKSIVYSDEIILDYNQDVFSFEFAALDYNSPAAIKYTYKMEGFDDNWIYSGSRRFATYTNLDPGRYTFKVKTTNADGVWNDNAKSVSIIIEPPFWMTWWFRSILIIVFLSLGPIIYYRRVSQLKKEKQIQIEFSGQLIQSQEDERKRIASELHDSLGQDLLVIKNLALLNKNKDDQFEEISKTASLALDEVRRISYNLHPYQLDRLGLTKAIQSMFVNIENATKIKFDLQVDTIDNLLSKDKEINIFRIVQECVNNILKHSGASAATVTVQNIENQIRIEIADNGKGFDFESVKEQLKGLGLKNLINRIALLEGEIDFISSNEFATIVKIKIPVNNE